MKRLLVLGGKRLTLLCWQICGIRSTYRFRQRFLWDKPDKVATHTIVDKLAAESAQTFVSAKSHTNVHYEQLDEKLQCQNHKIGH